NPQARPAPTGRDAPSTWNRSVPPPPRGRRRCPPRCHTPLTPRPERPPPHSGGSPAPAAALPPVRDRPTGGNTTGCPPRSNVPREGIARGPEQVQRRLLQAPLGDPDPKPLRFTHSLVFHCRALSCRAIIAVARYSINRPVREPPSAPPR